MAMEVTETDIQLPDNHCSDFLSVYIKQEHDDRETEFNEIKTVAVTQHSCVTEIKDIPEFNDSNENRLFSISEENNAYNVNSNVAIGSNLNPLQQKESCTVNSILTKSIYVGGVVLESTNEVQRQANKITQAFLEHQEQTQNSNAIATTATVTNGFLENINFNIKKENSIDATELYSMAWLDNLNNTVGQHELKDSKCRIQVPSDVEATPIDKNKYCVLTSDFNTHEQVREKPKKKARSRSSNLSTYRYKLRKKAACMREKRRKLYQEETEEERLQRLAREAAKKRESRMYYETPEKKKKRLDTEATRKREYRMYNESTEERRKRLDREAERRRLKRLSLHSRETPEERRERLDKESAKRREARLNQYAKETDEQRQNRLKREALRAREIRFTRSAIETEEERSERLVKEALRKREVRMRRSRSSSDSLTELRTVRNFEELNNAQTKDSSDSLLGGHYLSNWVVWLQNSLVQPTYHEEDSVEAQSRSNG